MCNYYLEYHFRNVPEIFEGMQVSLRYILAFMEFGRTSRAYFELLISFQEYSQVIGVGLEGVKYIHKHY